MAKKIIIPLYISYKNNFIRNYSYICSIMIAFLISFLIFTDEQKDFIIWVMKN